MAFFHSIWIIYNQASLFTQYARIRCGEESVSPVSLAISIPSVTATASTGETASVDPVTLTLSVPSVTATYVQVETASVSPVSMAISVPAVTAAEGGSELNRNYFLGDGGNDLAMQYRSLRMSTWSTSTRPSSPRKGDLGLNTQTSKFEIYNGSSWKTYSAD